MAIDLVTQYQPYVDEMFSTESKRNLLTNQDYSWNGAHIIKIYKVSTSAMNDYGRNGPATGNWSRYGEVKGLDTTTQSMTLRKDRSFTFAIDKLDEDETKRQLAAAAALARQLREVVIPEVDAWTYSQMAENAGYTPSALALTVANIYGEIIKGSLALDESEAPEEGRALVVPPPTYYLMKQSKEIIMETDIVAELRAKGVIAILDGMQVIRVPAPRLPENAGFLLAHPVATVAPVKLEDYTIHENPPGISGALVEGRIAYDAFVKDNKVKALYYQEVSA